MIFDCRSPRGTLFKIGISAGVEAVAEGFGVGGLSAAVTVRKGFWEGGGGEHGMEKESQH